MDCSRKEKGKKERQGGGRRKEAVNTKKSWSWGGGGVGVKGEIYGGRLLLHSAAPGRRRKRGGKRERQNIPFPLSLLPIQKPHGGGELCLRRRGEGGVFAQKRCFELRWNKRRASKGPGFTGPCTEKWK